MIKVLLVDENDVVIGEEEKIKAHEEGLLHRAFSLFLKNDKGEYLIQRRAAGKYHSGGLLSNSCCSHQYAGESEEESLNRALADELGITLSNFKEAGVFKYYSDYGVMHEHEIDHVYVADCNLVSFDFNVAEISEVFWMSSEEIERRLLNNEFTSWFKEAYGLARLFHGS